MTSLTPPELRTIYQTLRRAEDIRKSGVDELKDIFAEDARLIISPSNKCVASCFHCVADSNPRGEVMPYEDFVSIDPRFIGIFSAVDFGRRGNPLLYNSDKHDLADLMIFLNENGIDNFTVASAIQDHYVPIIGRLADFASQKEVNIETMVTYHHYFNELDTVKLAHDFNSALKNYLLFSRKIVVSLLGDQFTGRQQTESEEVGKVFYDHWDIIFNDFEVKQEDNRSYSIIYHGNESELIIPPVDNRVYPLGRFRQYLSENSLLEHYETQFDQSLSDYVCPDLIRWPGVIIEPDGGLNLCASFEAVACNSATVSNIFTKPYDDVQEELMQLHKIELEWFIRYFPDIIEGKVSTCKLKNNCYQ